VPVEKLIVMVEEPSMEAALEIILPKMLRPEIEFELRQFGCKSELLKRLPDRLKAYAGWLPKETLILVIVDRDDDDCKVLKARLNAAAHDAGLATRSSPSRGHFQVINRIAIEELEAWFWGDWEAVRAAYPKLDASVPQRAGYRDPDAVKGGTWEALERQLKLKGYFKQGLRKLELARAVSRCMDPNRNRSVSFVCLRDALLAL
jgi:hypothetical protein